MIGQEKREPDALRREAAKKDTRQEMGREKNEREENGRKSETKSGGQRRMDAIRIVQNDVKTKWNKTEQ